MRSLAWPARNWEKKTILDDYFEIEEGDKRCDPVTGNVEFDEDADDSTIMEGMLDDDEDERNISSALVPVPKRYSLPRHLIVDELVTALK